MKEMKILMVVNLLCVAAMMAFLAVVGPIIRALHMQEWHAGVTVALAGVVWVIMARYWGKKSDKVGRKPILLMGVLGVGISYLLLASYIDFALLTMPPVLVSLGMIVLARALIGVFYAAIPAVSNALIADKVVASERTNYMAKLGASSGFGMILGPAVGGYLAAYGLSTPLYAFAILPLVAAFLVYRTIPKTPKHHVEEVPHPKWSDVRLRLPMIAAFLTMYSVVTSQVCLGFFVIDTLSLDPALSAKVTGYILALVGVCFILAQIIVSKRQGISPQRWLLVGSIIATIGYGIVFMMNSGVMLGFGFCIAAFGMGLIFPAFQAMAANSVSEAEQGAAAGTVSSAQGLGIIIGPLASTALYGLNPIFPFVVASIAFALLGVFSFRHKACMTFSY